MIDRQKLKMMACQGQRIFVTCATSLQPLILFLFRLTWGLALYKTGKGKLLNHMHVVSFFTDLGIPFPDFNAWFVGALEYGGGALLVIGLCARPVAFMMTINMIVAYLSVAEDRAALFGVFGDYTPFLNADPFFFLLMSVLVLAFGPGAISIDAIIKNKIMPRYFCNKNDRFPTNSAAN